MESKEQKIGSGLSLKAKNYMKLIIRPTKALYNDDTHENGEKIKVSTDGPDSQELEY